MALAVVAEDDDLLFLKPEILIKPYRNSGEFIGGHLLNILLVQRHVIAVILILLRLDSERNDIAVGVQRPFDISQFVALIAARCVERCTLV